MKFYMAEATVPTNIEDTGFHPGVKSMLFITENRAVVSMLNNAVAPPRYKYIGQSRDLANINITSSLRSKLSTYFSLKQNIRANKMGKGLWEAMTLGADISNSLGPNPIEPNKRGQSSIYFDGNALYRERFHCTKEHALEVITRKKQGYADLRSNLTQARKWLYLQTKKGFDWTEIQDQYTDDGPPLPPSTVVTEVAASIPVNMWTGYNCTADFMSSTISINESAGHRAIHCETGVSDGDHTCTGTVIAGGTTTPLGPAVRMPAPMFMETKWFYTLYWWSGNWYLRCHDLNSVGTFSTLASGSMSGGSHLVEWITDVSGSDVSGSHDGNAIGPYTDTNAPDTQLYGGVYCYSSSAEMIPWELSDESGGGGGGGTTNTFMMGSAL